MAAHERVFTITAHQSSSVPNQQLQPWNAGERLKLQRPTPNQTERRWSSPLWHADGDGTGLTHSVKWFACSLQLAMSLLTRSTRPLGQRGHPTGSPKQQSSVHTNQDWRHTQGPATGKEANRSLLTQWNGINQNGDTAKMDSSQKTWANEARPMDAYSPAPWQQEPCLVKCRGGAWEAYEDVKCSDRKLWGLERNLGCTPKSSSAILTMCKLITTNK